jgi:hypothetical protein
MAIWRVGRCRIFGLLSTGMTFPRLLLRGAEQSRTRQREQNCQALAETQNGYGENFHGMAMRRTRILAPNPGSAHMLVRNEQNNPFDNKEVVD